MSEIDIYENLGHQQYFIFRLGGEVYGTPLSGVREVIEYQEPKRVPHMKDWFKGVINLRGKVVGMIDLRERFETKKLKTKCCLVFDTAQGPLIAAIDEGVAVKPIAVDQIETHPNVRLKVPANFLIGFANHGSEVIALIKLDEILSQEELVDLGKVHKAG